MNGPVPIRLTKRNFSVEERRSRHQVDEQSDNIRRAIIAATKLSGFYERYVEKAKEVGNPAMIMPRDAMQMLQQMRNQKVYVCETPSERDHEIVAASTVWDYELPVPSDDPEFSFKGYDNERFLEIGTQVCELPGFNLQWTLTAVSLIENFVLEPSGMVFAATYGDNVQSTQNFLRNMHFVPWSNVPPTLESQRMHHLRAGGMDEFARGVRWFRPTIKTLVEGARRIALWHENPVITASEPREGETRAVGKIHFTFEQSEFKAMPFSNILAASKALTLHNPQSYIELRAISSRTLSRNFVHFG